jgi:hypothetical protein
MARVLTRPGFTRLILAAATGLMTPAAASGAGSSAAGATPAATAATSMPARATLRVDADSLRITLELPKAALAAAGVLRAPAPSQMKAAVVDRDSLRGYLALRIFALQDDGMLAPEIRQVMDSSAADPAFAQVELVAGLLDTYTHFGFSSGLFRELEPPVPTQVRVEWRAAHAEFEASQTIQFIEPPAKGATTLELPGRKTPSAH